MSECEHNWQPRSNGPFEFTQICDKCGEGRVDPSYITTGVNLNSAVFICTHNKVKYDFLIGEKVGMVTRCKHCGEDVAFEEMDFPTYFEHQRKQAEMNDDRTGE